MMYVASLAAMKKEEDGSIIFDHVVAMLVGNYESIYNRALHPEEAGWFNHSEDVKPLVVTLGL